MKLELSVPAFSQLYSGATQVIVGADVLDDVSENLPESLQLLVLDATGCLTSRKSAADEGRRVMPVGMAANVLGIIAGATTKAAAEAWEAFAARQKMLDPIPMIHLSGLRRNRKAKASAFLLGRLVGVAASLHQQLGQKESSVAFLRDQNERLLLGFEKARRMIRGVGYGLQHIAAEIPRGDLTVGPGGDLDTNHFRQVLPCDSMALWGVSLFAHAREGADPSGHVTLKLWHASTGALLTSTERDFGALRDWTDFDLNEAAVTMFGDAVLEVYWHGKAENAPLFALSSVAADRFGDGQERSLAMRLMKGLDDPEKGLQSDVEQATGGLVRSGISVADAYWPFEQDKAHEGYGPELLSFPEEEQVQTHVSNAGPSAAMLTDALLPFAASVEATIHTAEEAGPKCLYTLVALEHLAGEDAEQRRAKLQTVLALESAGGSLPSGTHVAHKLMDPGVVGRLRLAFGKVIEGRVDIAMVARSMDERPDYGWCRWSDLVAGYDMNALVKDSMPPSYAGPATALRMRALKFPELAGRISFVSGKAKLEELSKSLGFSPLLVSEETGSLQTHPLVDHPSAAVLEAGVPRGALRVACDVETAHDSAPAFIYVLAVVDASVKDRERAIRNLLKRIDPADEATWQGINGRKTVQWQAQLLYARQGKTLELELAHQPQEAADLVFAVAPAGEAVSYGWCRWYSLSISSVPTDVKHQVEDDNVVTAAG